MPDIKTPLERARLTWKALAITGAVILILASLSSWAANNLPAIIYLLIVIAFADLGLIGYFVYNIVLHFNRSRKMRETKARRSGRVRLLLVSLLISAGAESIYATITDSWNEYALILLIGILFSILLVPFHYMYDEIRNGSEE